MLLFGAREEVGAMSDRPTPLAVRVVSRDAATSGFDIAVGLMLVLLVAALMLITR